MVATLVTRVVAAHGGARVQDVFENVVGIGTVRAGQLGADVAAGIEELVARQAGAVEDRPALRGVRRWVLAWKRASTCTCATRAALVFDVGWTLPQTASSRGRIRGSAKAQQLAGDRDTQIAARDAAALDGLQKRERPAGAGSQRGDRIGTLGLGVAYRSGSE